MNEWLSFNFIVPCDISTQMIMDVCYPSQYNIEGYNETNETIKHLVNFVNESDTCSEILMMTILQGLFCIFEGCTTDHHPSYESVFTDPKINSHFINNFSVQIGEFIEGVMDDLVNDSVGLLERENVDAKDIHLDYLVGVKLTDYQLNTLKEETIYQINANNEDILNIHQSTGVFEMIFDYLYRSGMLEDVYYRISNLYRDARITNYNIESSSINVTHYGDEVYRLDLRGTVSYLPETNSPKRYKQYQYYL